MPQIITTLGSIVRNALLVVQNCYCILRQEQVVGVGTDFRSLDACRARIWSGRKGLMNFPLRVRRAGLTDGELIRDSDRR